MFEIKEMEVSDWDAFIAKSKSEADIESLRDGKRRKKLRDEVRMRAKELDGLFTADTLHLICSEKNLEQQQCRITGSEQEEDDYAFLASVVAWEMEVNGRNRQYNTAEVLEIIEEAVTG